MMIYIFIERLCGYNNDSNDDNRINLLLNRIELN